MNTSGKVVELVKQQISNEYLQASDADVARVLRVSRTAISAYKNSRERMSQDVLARAQEVLKLSPNELLGLSLDLQMEASTEKETRSMLSSFRGLVAGTLLACLGLFTASGMQPAQAQSSPQPQLSSSRFIHYAHKRRRRPSLLDRLRDWFMIYPALVPA